MTKKKKLTYIDIFSGCGGLSLGFYNSGLWEGLFAVEKNKDAFQTLEHNLISNKNHFSFPSRLEESNHDINELINKKELKKLAGKVDLVAGGPPCQGFSLAGRRNINDIRNSLVYSYIKFIKIVQPKVIFFENVKGFCSPFKNKETGESITFSKIVIDELKKIGYSDASFEVLDFSDFGVPQSRKRFIIVATKKGNASDFFKMIKKNKIDFLKEKGLSEKNTLKDAISDLYKSHGSIPSPDTKGFQAGIYGKIKSPYQTYIRSLSKEKYPDSHRFSNHKQEIIKRFGTIIKEKLNSNTIQERFNTKKSSTRLLIEDKPSPTLTTLPDDLIHYSEPRILTVREYARIQSFPDNYIFKGKYTTGGDQRKLDVPRYTQIGNAIPPLFAEQAGLALYKLL